MAAPMAARIASGKRSNVLRARCSISVMEMKRRFTLLSELSIVYVTCR
jgi:hypothetical protein